MTIQETAALLQTMDRVLLLTHVRPDGDTIGSAAALCRALRDLGKTAYLLENPGITETYRAYAEPYWAEEDFEPDFVVSVDIAVLLRSSKKPICWPSIRQADKIETACHGLAN